MIISYLIIFQHYLLEILPALIIGFFLSGLINEFVPKGWIERWLGKNGIKPIFYSTISGTVLPICCWGSLPVAITFYKKGAKLGPVFAFLVATPATSVSALLVTYKLLGFKFAVFIFFAVIFMGLIIGLIGNKLTINKGIEEDINNNACCHIGCVENNSGTHQEEERRLKILSRIKSVFKFAFLDLVKEIGLETLLGIALAALVTSAVPIKRIINLYLSGSFGYFFSLIFGLIMYICATATVPLVDAFIKQGLSYGAGMVLLLAGPVTSYGTILVLKKKFGTKILLFYLASVSFLSLIFGYLFSLI